MTKNEIQIFSNPEFGEVRTAKSESGKAFFCLADLCKALELSQPSRVRERLKSNGLILIKVIDSMGREQEAMFVDEPNLYRCILKSRKKEAEKFQDWVCEEVLPKLRSDGVVMVDRGTESPEELMARALSAANEILAKREARIKEVEQSNTLLLEENQEQKEQIETLQADNESKDKEIKSLLPKAEYYNDVLQSDATYTVTELSRELGFGTPASLNRALKEMRIQYKKGEQWLLHGGYVGKGLTKPRTCVYKETVNDKKTKTITVWTELGRRWLHDLLKRGYLIPIAAKTQAPKKYASLI